MTANRKENSVQASQTAQPGNTDLDAAHKLLRSVFGFSSFRDGQAEIIADDPRRPRRARRHADRQRQVAVLPAPGAAARRAHHRGLAADRADAQPGGAAARATASPPRRSTPPNDFSENRDIAEQIARGELRLAYIAPERLAKPEIIAMLRTAKLAPARGRRGPLHLAMGPRLPPRLHEPRSAARRSSAAPRPSPSPRPPTRRRAPTSSARLFPAPPELFVHGFDRPNLRLAMSPRRGGRGQLLQLRRRASAATAASSIAARARRPRSSRSSCAAKASRRCPITPAWRRPTARATRTSFLQEDGVVMVATIAFGMGIDKPDVRFVCHANMPSTIESYYQEIGRAGRDGLPADTLTLFGMGDITLRRRQIEESSVVRRAEAGRPACASTRWSSLCESPRCRRQTLLRYFGETSRAVRQLRRLRRRRRGDRRHRRRAEGDVGDPAHRRAVRHRAPGRSPARRGDRGDHANSATTGCRPSASARRTTATSGARSSASSMPPA